MKSAYVYHLVSKDGHLYVGSRTKKDVDPRELFSSYFTSSEYVEDLIRKNGQEFFSVAGIELFDDPVKAYWREQEIIQELWGNPKLLNKKFHEKGSKGPFCQAGRTGDKQYRFGKGYLAAGENNPMFGKVGAMKGITGKDHPAYGADKSGPKNGMFGIRGELNHWYGTPPWEVPISKKLKTDVYWLKAGEAFDLWKQGLLMKKITAALNIGYSTAENMVCKFRAGWVPSEDNVWLEFKNRMGILSCVQ